MTMHRSLLPGGAWRFATVFVLCACNRSAHQPFDSTAADRMVGIWDAQFTSTGRFATNNSTANPGVRGEIAFIVNRTHITTSELPSPTNVGTFDVDFSPLGFNPINSDDVPSVAAVMWSSDSVSCELGAGQPGEGVWMRGQLKGDSITGTWTLVRTRAAASGTFLLKRQERHR